MKSLIQMIKDHKASNTLLGNGASDLSTTYKAPTELVESFRKQPTKLALMGAHRTGKTTLAEEVAKQAGIQCQRIGIGQLQKEIGYDSANQSYSFDDRILIQDHLLKRVKEITQSVDSPTIFDRCALDLVGYASLAITDNLSVEQGEWFKQYVLDCVQATNEHMDLVVLIQPGIKLSTAETSARPCEGMMQALNLTYTGMLHHEDLRVRTMILPADITNLQTRTKLITNRYLRTSGALPNGQ